jgi:ribose transport system ATP-binding protein
VSVTDDTVLEVRQITKRFPGVLALDAVDLDVRVGEVHVIVGQNGAGKSTLAKIICGLYHPDAGTMTYRGKPYRPASILEARQSGVNIIYQELSVLPRLTVAENIFLGRYKHHLGIIDRKALFEECQQLLDQVGLDVSPNAPLEGLGVAEMQLVEIARVLSSESNLLIMDEPTAMLAKAEIANLFRIVRRLKTRGVSFIYISHRLREIYEIGDRVTVFRDGRTITTRQLREIRVQEIIKQMVGRELTEQYPKKDTKPGRVVFRVEKLTRAGVFENISLAVREGEIHGIAGLIGSGRTEVARAIFGADPVDSGRILLNGDPIRIRTPQDAVRHGICLLVEDRKAQGLLLPMSVAANITLPALEKVSAFGLIQPGKEDGAAQQYVALLGVRTPNTATQVSSLSGGNQQKVVMAKWLFRESRLFIFDEPTRGIDVGAKREIYGLLMGLTRAGRGILIISSDLEELMELCDRITVFSRGRVAGTLDRPQFSEEAILSLAYKAFIEEESEVPA